ncbi:FMN-binding protein [Curtobacterium sp. ZW137]|uniref:FMN-binding protein n=1 Tax=Curtobacterium sp. ZW137 TaxID=2485104 RepID=UPI0021A5B0D2|nr:FMN-binding protein [Curtobacterium sp. ZW137]
MRKRIVIGGALVSLGIIAAGVEAGSLQATQTTTQAGGTTGTGTSGTENASSGSGSSAADGTYTGTAVSTRYGDVQVEVTVAGGKLTEVTALQLTDDDPRSSMISAQAAPVLRQEALTAQSAQIDTVSGATYTSDGYIQSLQSALDQAGM